MVNVIAVARQLTTDRAAAEPAVLREFTASGATYEEARDAARSLVAAETGEWQILHFVVRAPQPACLTSLLGRPNFQTEANARSNRCYGGCSEAGRDAVDAHS